MRTSLIFLLALLSCGAGSEEPRMASNYGKLLVVSNHGIETQATLLAITNKKALVSFHAFEAGTRPATPSGEGNVAVIGKVVDCSPFLDLCVVEFTNAVLKPKRIRFADPVPGEQAFVLANAMGKGPTFHIVTISKVTDEEVLFTPALPKGTSGAGVFNADEKLVAVIRGSYTLEDSAPMGFALPSKLAKPLIIKHLARPKVTPFPDASQGEPP